MTRSMLILANAAAGAKGGLQTNDQTLDDVRQVIANHDPTVEVIETHSEDESASLARDAVARGVQIVVAAGGDGTVGCIARELLDTGTTLGILPLGSVMNIARMLGIPRDLDAAASVLFDGRVRAIDVGRANGVLFFECGSVGLNAAVFREVQRFDSGEYRSLLSALWVAIRYRPARMAIQLDDLTLRTRALMITVANGPYTGVGFTVAPDAIVDDGRFDVSVFRHFSRAALFVHLARTAFGRRHYSPRVDTYRSTRVHVETASALPSRADGNDLGTTPVDFVVVPAALRVIVPWQNEQQTAS